MGGDGAPAPSAPRSAAQRHISQRRICPIFRPLNAGGDAAGAASPPKNSVFVQSPLREREKLFLRWASSRRIVSRLSQMFLTSETPAPLSTSRSAVRQSLESVGFLEGPGGERVALLLGEAGGFVDFAVARQGHVAIANAVANVI